MTTRVYVAASVPLLRQWWAAGELAPGSARFVAAEEDEEAEYAALEAAADASATLTPAPARRVVVVAETTDPDAGVPLRHVVAVHADTEVGRPGSRPPGSGAELGWFATQEVPGMLDRWAD